MDVHELPKISFDNTFSANLEHFYVPWKADKVPAPRMLLFNDDLAADLGLDAESFTSGGGAEILSGNLVPDGATPLAQVYAGHQFGGFSPQLGDGRALLLGEIVDPEGKRWDMQLKGSGRTPFSRGGDGKSALGPVLREYLISEAMHALGIPTTRSLAAVATGETVQRETALPGAVLTRIAASHIRVGTFQFFASQQQTERVRELADYAIARHYPELRETETRYLDFFRTVAARQAALVASWMHIGFIHGVMNTDNMTISGETIDYGPCAFLDTYAPDTVFSSIDAHGRYAFGNQPIMAQWNLTRLAEALLRIIDDDADRATELLTDEINAFPGAYMRNWLSGMRRKLGLLTEEDADLDLVNGLFNALPDQNVDYTLFFRRLSNAATGDDSAVRALFDDPEVYAQWATRWHERLKRESASDEQRAHTMNAVNPIYVPRNHQVEAALESAVQTGSLDALNRLQDVLARPFEEREGLEDYTRPAPDDFGPYRTFCGT